MMASQSYVIVSHLNGLALDVEGGNPNPGARIFTWPKHGNTNQQWYDDPSTGTIRSRLNNFCMDVENGQLCLKPFQQGDQNQQWERRGNQIANRYNTNEVLDIIASEKNQGAKVTKYQFNGGPNQSWTFEFVGGQAQAQPGYPGVQASTYPAYPGTQQAYPAYPPSQTSYPPAQPQQRQEFFIVSEMNGKVLDIKGGSKDAGAPVIVWSKHPQQAKNQKWYFDPQGFIRSALNDMVFTATSGQCLKMAPASGDRHSQWRFDGNKVVNQAGDVLDIVRGSSADGAEICAYKHHGKENQRWRKEID